MSVSTIVMDRDRTFIWALAISVVIHVIVLVPYLEDVIPDEFFEAQAQVPLVPPIEFELVSPAVNPTPTDRASHYLSTVDSEASDQSPDDTDSPLPQSSGEVPIPELPSPEQGEEGGGESDVLPLPESKPSLAEAFKRSRVKKQSSPTNMPSLPPEAPEFKSSGSARASFGGISINTTAWDFAPYLLDLKHRIKQHWIPPIAFTALGAIHGYTRINFRVYPDGHMEQLSVVDSDGHGSLHKSSGNAIKSAAPFRPLPEDFPEDYLDVTFGFYYLLPGDAERYFPSRTGR